MFISKELAAARVVHLPLGGAQAKILVRLGSVFALIAFCVVQPALYPAGRASAGGGTRLSPLGILGRGFAVSASRRTFRAVWATAGGFTEMVNGRIARRDRTWERAVGSYRVASPRWIVGNGQPPRVRLSLKARNSSHRGDFRYSGTLVGVGYRSAARVGGRLPYKLPGKLLCGPGVAPADLFGVLTDPGNYGQLETAIDFLGIGGIPLPIVPETWLPIRDYLPGMIGHKLTVSAAAVAHMPIWDVRIVSFQSTMFGRGGGVWKTRERVDYLISQTDYTLKAAILRQMVSIGAAVRGSGFLAHSRLRVSFSHYGQSVHIHLPVACRRREGSARGAAT